MAGPLGPLFRKPLPARLFVVRMAEYVEQLRGEAEVARPNVVDGQLGQISDVRLRFCRETSGKKSCATD